MKRTHHCNELRPAHSGQTVTLSGWVHSRRDLGGLIFIDIRDREGRTQTVFDPSDLPKELFDTAASLRSECVISVTGKVRQRPQGTNNSKIPTGTPEGAREFLVPNRRDPGTFYALPQSPQQFKQICMVGGIERYYQLARCFRDEDQRADRQLEFTQVDIEMSFIEREDIYALIEGLLKRVWKIALDRDIPTPFRRISFEEALNRYGIDKPDTRFGMELVDFTETFRASTFKVFSGAIANGGVVKALNAKGLAGATQGQIETMTEYAKSFGAKGLEYIKVERGPGGGVEWKSPIVKLFNDIEKEELTQKLGIEGG